MTPPQRDVLEALSDPKASAFFNSRGGSMGYRTVEWCIAAAYHDGRAVDAVLDKGLVIRVREPKARGNRELELTERGREFLRHSEKQTKETST